MKSFLKYVFASSIGFFLAGGLLIMLFFFMIMAAVSSIGSDIESQIEGEKKEVKANSVLTLDLNYPIPERTSEDPLENFDFATFESKNLLGLNDILRGIEHAATDDNIKGIYIKLGAYQSGLATTQAIREALEDFQESGKFVVAFGDYATQRSYHLASVADEIYLNPHGGLDFRGYGARLAFFQGTLEKLNIDVQIFHRGKYKSAIEPFSRKEMSEANREQMTAILSEVYDVFLSDISDSRSLSTQRVDLIADSLLAVMPSDAVKQGLLDGTRYHDEVMDLLKDKVGIEEDEDLEKIGIGDYSKAVKSVDINDNKLAVIYATGAIVDGEGESSQIGGDRYAETIRDIREDEDIKAVVLRINSGGGSALASEIIWREIQLTKEVKPVIVSFGDVAASGGYYIACNGDKIYAEETSITGSIGVFGMIPNMSGLFTDKLGVTYDEVTMNENAIIDGVSKPLSDYQAKIIQQSVDSIYETFLSRVATGRGMTRDEVHAIAQGRVWTGTAALNEGLIDEFGGLDAAIEEAASAAGLDDYAIRSYPKYDDPFMKIFSGNMAQAKDKILETELGETYTTYRKIRTLLEGSTIQAIMPYEIEIQ